MWRMVWSLIIVWSIVSTVIAQDTTDDCPLREQEALKTMQRACLELAAGEICYGNDTLSVLQQADTASGLNEIGDRAAINEIFEWSVSQEDNTWGVAALNLSLYPDTSWEAQPIFMLAFGNVQVVNLGQEDITIFTQDIPITAPEGANIRVQPNTEYRVIQPILQGDFVKATGRLSDSSWIRIQLRDGTTGWVSSLTVDTDITELPVVTANQSPPQLIYPPMQVFSFQSGMSDARCREASPSGVLLQTPAGATSPAMIINDVEIRFSGTIFIQAQPQSTMIINTLEGEAEIVASDERRFIPTANRVQIPMELNEDNHLIPADIPAARETYIYEQLLFVPVDYLPRAIYVAPDLERYITPRPELGNSPLEGMPLDALCTITVGPGGVNLRAGPGTDYAIQGVMDFRESAKPIGRVILPSGESWWKLADFLWVRVDTTVTGGDCFVVPSIDPPTTR